MTDLPRFILQQLRPLADPGRARAMAAYMKTDMPFFGVRKPQRLTIEREAAQRFAPRTHHEYRTHVLSVWAQSRREEKYLAIALARRWKHFVIPASLPLYRRLIVEGGWWDFVDEVAIHLVGPVLRSHRSKAASMVRRWIDHRDLWLRRSAIICQVAHKEHTDLPMLLDFCLRRSHEREFFIRKAIGWALREHARTAPAAIRSFLRESGDRLSPLSVREARKHLGPDQIRSR